MDPVNNNQFEVVPAKSKRKIIPVCPNVYLNPALDLLANEDPMCNTAMEIIPVKKRKRSKSCDIIAFENSALDVGVSRSAVNEFLARELGNVCKNLRYNEMPGNSNNSQSNFDITLSKTSVSEPNITIYGSDSFFDKKISNFSLNSNIMQDIESSGFKRMVNSNITINKPTSEPIYANLTEVSNQSMSEIIDPDNTVTTQIVPCTSENIPVVVMQNSDVDTNTFELLKTNLDVSMKTENDVETLPKTDILNEVYSGISIVEHKSTTTNLENNDISAINTTNVQTNITNQIFLNNPSNLSLSFIDRLALDSPNLSNQSLIFDDDLNESNIMEIKTITIITKTKRVSEKKKNTNPFLDPELKHALEDNETIATENPFLSMNDNNSELEYTEEMMTKPIQGPSVITNPLMPRRLFSDNNSTISTFNESVDQHEYENIDGYRSESPVYENVGEMNDNFNKQSKILGQDVSHFSAVDIMNLNKQSQINSSNESNDSKKDLRHQILRASKRVPKKIYKTLKKTFKGEKHSSVQSHNTTLNPYEIPRKIPKDKKATSKDSGIENPCMNLDASDIEIEEIENDDEEEHQYEDIKTLRNTRLNMNVTPLKERTYDNTDTSHNRTNTPGKKVRFDSTLNQEKYITGNSFDNGIQSPGFDAKIEKYHDELENCINEKKYLQQNM